MRRKSSSRLGRGQSSADEHVIASTVGGGLLRQHKVFLNLTASGLRERERVAVFGFFILLGSSGSLLVYTSPGVFLHSWPSV